MTGLNYVSFALAGAVGAMQWATLASRFSPKSSDCLCSAWIRTYPSEEQGLLHSLSSHIIFNPHIIKYQLDGQAKVDPDCPRYKDGQASRKGESFY